MDPTGSGPKISKEDKNKLPYSTRSLLDHIFTINIMKLEKHIPEESPKAYGFSYR